MDKKTLCILALFILAPISCSDNSSRSDDKADIDSSSRPAIGQTTPTGGEPMKKVVPIPLPASDEKSAPTGRQSAANDALDPLNLPTTKTVTAEAMNQHPSARQFQAKQPGQWSRESYDALEESRFINTLNDPLSTFSIDVDTASYANVRRFITGGALPPAGAVRAEEMINYFRYTLPEPAQNKPLSLQAEVGPSPFHAGYKLVKIGLKARDIAPDKMIPSNLVFLVDVSGSMNQPDKLPLLKQSLKLLATKLTRQDRVAMVVYAGSDRVVLQPTPGDDFKAIVEAVDNLHASGSTHASSGIVTAYELATRSFIPGGNNRVILVSDGDFNVGVTSRSELQSLIEEQRKSGVYLTVLGFGSGNYHDDTMQVLADKGNGNYAYIDSLLEAKKVLIKERSGTLFTLARDVKIQVEFNPALVGAYRLIGYENRKLADEDFRDDRKDAGEVGMGHNVTALYELIPAGSDEIPAVDELTYQKPAGGSAAYSKELLTVKLRYKPDGSERSTQITARLEDRDTALEQTSVDFRFAASVAGFAMLLKSSDQLGSFSWDLCLDMARQARGEDADGYRAEFARLVEMAQLLSQQS
jgi:Ca-activated chloride channel family protein